MYSIIRHPSTNENIKLRSLDGINLINNYYKYLKNQNGGKFIGKGTYKCVFKPAIKCNESKIRFGDKKSKNYISAITTYSESKIELKMEKIRAKIDPDEKFTVKIQKTCPIGKLDKRSESKKEFLID